MRRLAITTPLLLAISLTLSAIWQPVAVAALAPDIAPLGRIDQGMAVATKVDLDGSGNLFLADAGQGKVLKYDMYGELTAEFEYIAVSGRGLAVNPEGTRIFAAENTAVTILDAVTGEQLGQLGSGAGEFTLAGEIDLDAQGRIFVADNGAKAIKVYQPDGTFLYQFGRVGTYNGQFWSIRAMSVNEALGEVYVADHTGRYSRLQVFSLEGAFKRVIPFVYMGSPYVVFMAGMTFDDAGRIYLLDSFRSDIRILGLPSAFLSRYDNVGYGLGQLKTPFDVIYDPTHSRLFVVCDGPRVEVLGIDGGVNPIPVQTNEPPGAPTLVAPVADSEVGTPTPELSFQNAIDPDGDSLFYDVQVFQEDALAAGYDRQPESAEISSVTAGPLTENARFTWVARAFDGEDVSEWTSAESFWVNAVEEAPLAPALVAPLEGEALDGQGALEWKAASDPDPFDTVGYFLEIAEDSAFEQMVLTEDVDGVSVSLGGLAGYMELKDGQDYFWRARAIDNHGLVSEAGPAGSFRYDTTLLQVTSNMPGAKVYVGGNLAYPGRYVGEAPLEIRDFTVGASSVVVDRAGFERFVGQVFLLEKENGGVYAELVPAIAPQDFKATPLTDTAGRIVLDGDAVPFAVDFDNDGLIDLLTGDASGRLTLFPGVPTEDGSFEVSAGTPLDLPTVPGAAPFVADWDEDGRKDLLVGAADGTVTLYLNTGTEIAPAYGAGSFLLADGVPLTVGSDAVPAVVDADGDGDKDLAVGSSAGGIHLFRNDGDDAAPQLKAAGLLLSTTSPVAPFFVDWDADGTLDLLAAAGEHLYRCARQADGRYVMAGVLTVGSDLIKQNGTLKNGKGGNGTATNGAFSLGEKLRLFVFDADGQKGKDLLVGNALGELRLARSLGREPVPAFQPALTDKLSQIDGLVREMAPDLIGSVEAIALQIEAGKPNAAAGSAEQLLLEVAPGTEVAIALAELIGLLQ